MKTTCAQTSLHDFIRCFFHQEYKVLSEGEKCTDEQLNEAWQAIYEEYCIISGSLDHVKIMKCLNEIIRLQKILYYGSAAVFVLCYEYSEPDIEVLKKIGFNYEFSKTDHESFIKDVEKCAKKLKGFDLQLQVQQKKRLELFGFDENGNQKNNKQQQTEGDFLKSVAIVGKSNGYHISLKNTMLDEWAGMVKLHNEMNKK